MVLYADGVLCGCTVNERILATVWAVPVGEAAILLPCCENMVRSLKISCAHTYWVNPVELPMYLSTRGDHDLALNINFTLYSGVGSPSWCKDEGYQPCAADS